MNINYKQSQFELFSTNPENSLDTDKPRYLFAHLTLSLENIALLSILIVMSLIFFYSVGVEKGKRISRFNEGPAVQSGAAAAQEVNNDSRIDLKQKDSAGSSAVLMASAVSKRAAESAGVTASREPIADDGLTSQKTINSDVPSTESAKQYTVQVASYKGEKYALKETMLLKQKGFEAFILPKGNYTIVCVGQFLEKKEASKTLDQLRKLYSDSLVRRL